MRLLVVAFDGCVGGCLVRLGDCVWTWWVGGDSVCPDSIWVMDHCAWMGVAEW